MILALLATLAAAPAGAQDASAPRSPLVRADVHGTLGWFNAEADVANRYDDWYNRSLYGGAGFGWYWTDHLKTEIEFGASSEAELYSNEPLVLSGRPIYLGIRKRFGTKRIGVSQQYQFFRNVWFHPHVAAGLDLRWETIERRDDPVHVYDPITGQPRLVRDARQHPTATRQNVRPFASAGFKAYLTQRSFFRTDVRAGVGDGVDEMVLRLGFGVDF